MTNGHQVDPKDKGYQFKIDREKVNQPTTWPDVAKTAITVVGVVALAFIAYLCIGGNVAQW